MPEALHVILTDQLAGTERHVMDLAWGLRRNAWTSSILTLDTAEPELLAGYREVASLLLLTPGRPSVTDIRTIFKKIRANPPDVVHGHLGRGAAVAALIGAALRRPAVMTQHFVRPRHLTRPTWWRKQTYRVLISQMRAVIAVSEAVRAGLAQQQVSSASNTTVVPNGLRDMGFTLDGESTPPTVLYVGRLSPEKDVEVLIQAMATTSATTRLDIAGRGPLAGELEHMGHALLGDRVRFLGFRFDVNCLLAEARVLCLPSREEPFGLAAVEAMRASRPVVASRAGGIVEVIVDGETGLLVEPGSPHALAQALERVLVDPQYAAQLGSAGRRRFKERFSATVMAAATIEVYESAVQARSASDGRP